MIPTLFGVITMALGIFMLLRSTQIAMLQMTLLLSLMGGSAAVVLPSLGGSTVQPAILALTFLILKCALPRPQQNFRTGAAINDLKFLILFAAYGAVSAQILPRIFAKTIDVTPLRPIPNGYLFAAYPLGFSNQNVTAAVYLLATLFAAICAYAACSTPRSEYRIARTASVVAGIHALLGLSSVFLAGTLWSSVLSYFRNGYYAQLDQTFGGFVRMNGIWPEPAVFSNYAFAWMLFNTELWLRNVLRRWTGWGAFMLAIALLMSTSTTAYIGLAAYSLVIGLRILIVPSSVSMRHGLIFLMGGLVATAALLALIVISPDAATTLGSFAAKFTIDKVASASALQRGFWAQQGLDAFWVSGGLGIGPGSFRSSSLVTAILGSMGVVGAAAFVVQIIVVLKPFSRSTYAKVTDNRIATGVAAAWASVIMLIPSQFSAASPDPGIVWGFFCGIAMALRRREYAKENESIGESVENEEGVARL
jgi:hypothetical protein